GGKIFQQLEEGAGRAEITHHGEQDRGQLTIGSAALDLEVLVDVNRTGALDRDTVPVFRSHDFEQPVAHIADPPVVGGCETDEVAESPLEPFERPGDRSRVERHICDELVTDLVDQSCTLCLRPSDRLRMVPMTDVEGTRQYGARLRSVQRRDIA